MKGLNQYLALGSVSSQIVVQHSQSGLHLGDETALTGLIESVKAVLTSSGDDQVLWLLAYLDHALCWGIYQNGQLETFIPLDPGRLQELRLFGPAGEFYLWRNGPAFNSRLRLDNDLPQPLVFKTDQKLITLPDGNGFSESPVKDPNYAEEWHILWGTQLADIPAKASWTAVKETGRGVEYAIPHRLVESQLPLRVRVRHYLSYAGQTGLASYNDMRLVELCDADFKRLK